MKRTVIDTNVFVSIISSGNKFHAIYRALLEKRFELAVSNEIVLEYEEVIAYKYGMAATRTFLTILSLLPNVMVVNPSFHWNLITNDADDNKFADCAISAGVHYLVSDDKHFNVLKEVDFPKVNVISTKAFFLLLEQGKL